MNYSCRACIEMSNFGESHFYKVYPTLKSNSFFKTEHFQVKIPIGPLYLGHLLILTNNHQLSIASIYDLFQEELHELIDRLNNFYKKNFDTKRFVIFEHGAISEEKTGGCCLNHAHFNLLPINNDINIFKKASEYFEFRKITFSELGNYSMNENPYLFFYCSKEGTYIANCEIGVSQFFRKLLSELTVDGIWDWRIDNREQIVYLQHQLLSKFNEGV